MSAGTPLAQQQQQELFIYAPTGSDKEDWFFMLRRSSKLPAFADSGALSAFYQEADPMRAYTEAMDKLIQNTSTGLGASPEHQATAWLNALVGRVFVAVHSNPYIKDWFIHRLTRRAPQQTETSSFLGDIVIQDLNVGNSLPVLSNPKLVNISVEGDMNIEMDIDYTGGVRIEAATVATLSVPAWDAYMKPITVPIVVAVKIKRFSARVLLKVKPFWETNRIWFGFYRKPELKLELEVEPIISNKLIKIQMVNQVIERRIKEALEESFMLPNMDDLSFTPFEDIIGTF
ncbi:putative integral membrane protein conserved region-domain-containing protein, partial [Entophlyctis helioformis]